MILLNDFMIKIIDGTPNWLKEILIKHKKHLLFYLSIIVLLALGILLVFNNYKWYDTSIAKIIKVENSFDHESEGNDGEIENYYNQQLVGIIMNGEFKEFRVTIENLYSSSGVYDDEYKVGDEVFITIKSTNKNKVIGTILGLKRDKYIAILFSLLFLFILLVAKKRGILSIVSLILNIFVFWLALDLYKKGTNILFLSNCMVIFFTSTSLLLINGVKKSTFIAIISTLVSICFTMIILRLVMISTEGIDYAFMEYITSPDDLPEIFMSQILLGGLGAIMDVSITMSSTVNELVMKDSKIPINKLIKSGREVGYDIMGTMINVMLFTYICGSIPIIILKMKSQIRLITIILLHIPMELYRFLLGSIGILLTIPVSLFISILILKIIRRQL